MNTDSLHIVCPHCDAANRLPAARLHEQPRCGRCRQALFDGHPLALDGPRLHSHLSRSDLPVVIDFWAPWCGPCLSMAPAYERAAAMLEPRARLAKVDTQAHPELGTRYGIRSIPTLVVFKNGQEIARQSGALPAAALTQWIGQYC
jgi:thioredoxin 2